MKAFRFTLEAVQTVRHRQEQQALENYVQSLLARQQVLDRLDGIRDQIRGHQQEINALLLHGCTAAALTQLSQYARSLEKLQSDQILALALAERRVNGTFQAMILARQQRKIVETFRGKQLARHQQAEAREEQKFLDDLASRRGHLHQSWNAQEAVV
jgi:flagellar export protein FliJ